jgi:hypothetical protein
VTEQNIHPNRIFIGHHLPHRMDDTNEHATEYASYDQVKLLLEYDLSMTLLMIRCVMDKSTRQLDFLKLASQYGKDNFSMPSVQGLRDDDQVLKWVKWMIQEAHIPANEVVEPTFLLYANVSDLAFQSQMSWLLDWGWYEVDEPKRSEQVEKVREGLSSEQYSWLQDKIRERQVQVGQMVDQLLGNAVGLPHAVGNLISLYYI